MPRLGGRTGHEGEIQCRLEVIELALHAPQLRADVGRYLVAKVPNAQRAAAQYAKQRAKDKDDLGNSNRTPRVLFGGRAGRHPRIQPSSARQEHFAGWRLLTSRLTDLTRLRSVPATRHDLRLGLHGSSTSIEGGSTRPIDARKAQPCVRRLPAGLFPRLPTYAECTRVKCLWLSMTPP